MELREQLLQYTKETEDVVYSFLPKEEGHQKTIFEAMNYSGEGWREAAAPSADAGGLPAVWRNREGNRAFMAAIEMIHTSSLIHDDLPVWTTTSTGEAERRPG